MSDTTSPSLELPIDAVWIALMELLSFQLDDCVCVDTIGEKDFDEEGQITTSYPAARVVFGAESAAVTENQNQVYNARQTFAVLCADEDLGPDPQDQRLKSLRLLGAVKHILTGARLLLRTGDVTEPIVYVSTSVLPNQFVRTVYVAEFSVGGIAQFAAPNAYPPPSSAEESYGGQ